MKSHEGHSMSSELPLLDRPYVNSFYWCRVTIAPSRTVSEILTYVQYAIRDHLLTMILACPSFFEKTGKFHKPHALFGLLADVNSPSRSLLAIAIPSVVCLSSVVCDVGAPYSAG